MVARGQVGSLDDQLVTYCPEFSMMTEYNITLKQLASQVSQRLNIIHINPTPRSPYVVQLYTRIWLANLEPCTLLLKENALLKYYL